MKRVLTILLISLFLLSCNRERVVDTWKMPGNKNSYTPVEALPKVEKFVTWRRWYAPHSTSLGEPYLLAIEANYIKSDGTMDIEADYEPTVEYSFMIEVTPDVKKEKKEKKEKAEEAKDVPIGAGHRVEQEVPESTEDEDESQPYWMFRTIAIVKPYKKQGVTGTGGGYNYSSPRTWIHGGMKRSTKYLDFQFTDEAKVYFDNMGKIMSADPPISFASIWQKAMEAGAPENAVALIKYDVFDGYTFEIVDTEYNYSFDLSGALIE